MVELDLDDLVQFEDEERTCSNCRYYRPLNWFEGDCTDPLRGYTKGCRLTYSFVIGNERCVNFDARKD